MGHRAAWKRLAKAYRALTGRPLGRTGEVAEYEAARILRLDLSEVRQAGYAAVRRVDGHTQRLQIKGRCMLPTSKPSQRIGSIRLDHESVPSSSCFSTRMTKQPRFAKRRGRPAWVQSTEPTPRRRSLRSRRILRRGCGSCTRPSPTRDRSPPSACRAPGCTCHARSAPESDDPPGAAHGSSTGRTRIRRSARNSSVGVRDRHRRAG